MRKNFFMNNRLIYALIGLATVVVSCQPNSKYAGPLTPEETVKTFQFAGPFKAEVFASEPLVADPVSMVFAENGDAYVVEMADANMPDSLKGRGQIVILRDLDKDGKADTSIVFATGLKEATTVLPWKGGLIVTAAPEILYLKDTTGDGKADIREVLFAGFFEDNDEAQITSLRFGVDNWIYANNDGEPGEVTFTRKPDASPLSMRGADFRFRLDRNEFERTTGPGQYGQAIDDWGHRFFTKNSLHIQQVVIPWRYVHRNPYLPAAVARAIKNISDHDPIMFQRTPAPYWRDERTKRRNKAFEERNLPPTEYAKDHFTGASGGTFYGGDAFGDPYYGSVFTGDVAGNLVHRDVLATPADGHDPFYVAQRGEGEQQQEFLASTDPWFRPTNFETGPDGCLYVVDMYRQHIETPVSIPDDLAAEMDFSAGSDKGRIYRILPQEGTGKAAVPDLEAKTSSALVELLSHPNRWWRLHAHKLLIERQDKSVVPAVKALFGSSPDDRVRIQALYVLEGLDALDADVVRSALKDASPGVRENAAMLAEHFPACLPQLEALIDDPSARVAFQATLSLGEFKGNNITNDLAKVLEKYGSNSWFRAAVLSSEPGSSISLVKQLTAPGSFMEKASWGQAFLKDIAYVIGAGEGGKSVNEMLALPVVKENAAASAIFHGLIEGLNNAGKVDSVMKEKVKAIQTNFSKDPKTALEDLKKLYH